METESSSLAPGLLLAAPRLDDPNFEHTVVLLAQHDEDGAIGWVLNGSELPSVRDLLAQAELVPEGTELPDSPCYDLPVRVAGPVMPGSVWMLFRKAPGAPVFPGELMLDDEHAITGAREVIEAVARGEGPDDFRLFLGYAGWGPGQLEGEIGEGAWLPSELDASLLFDEDVEALWETAYRNAVGLGALQFTSGPKGLA